MTETKPGNKAGFRAGYAVLIGRPNAGKSTLLNKLLESKLAITSSKPQTTRTRIVGIHTDERMQVVLMDTPGVHTGWTELNKHMVAAALSALGEVDLVLWLVDTTVLARRCEAGESPFDAEDESLIERLVASKKPIVLVCNKVDVVPKPLVLPVLDACSKKVALAAAVPLSALTGDGVQGVVDEIFAHLPVHEPFFPADVWTEASERFLAGEIVREKIFQLTEQEVPYATAVEIMKFDETERETGQIVRIMADIIVEKGSQKGILIGKGGEMLKRIGTLARKEIADLLGCRVYLELFVKVERDWTKTRNGLRKAGYEG